MTTIYLAGPILGCNDSECKDWRELAKKILPAEKFFDPMARDYRGCEDNHIKEIVEDDKKDIDASDILVVYYNKPSVGTSMEIIYAWERNKTVLIVVPPGLQVSPWLKYHSHGIFKSLAEVAAEIFKRE